MPSPFPGMDPWLEDPSLWPDVHHRLIGVSSELLTAQLRPRYFAQIEERLWIADQDDLGAHMIVPDIRVLETPRVARRPTASGGVATVEPGIRVKMKWSIEVKEKRLELRDLRKNRVVTIIEFLSPANKTPGSAGCASYNEKRDEALAAGCNFVELDLLRAGRSVFWPLLQEPDYLAAVTRPTADGEPESRAWPMWLRDRLKAIPIPLLPEDNDAVLDLQQVFDLAYDRAGYDLRINYQDSPRPRLEPGDQDWANQLLMEKGLLRQAGAGS